MTEHPRTRGVRQLLSTPSEEVFATRYLRYVTPQDIAEYDDETIARDVRSLIELGTQRDPDTPVTAMWPAGLAGEAVIAVITDDMPFLVDSVTSAITSTGRDIRLIIHPQVVVLRDAAGHLLDILDLDPDEPRPDDAIVESWTRYFLEPDYQPHDDARVLEAIGAALHDVRVAVRDWQPMQQRALDIAGELEANPPVGLPEEEVRQGVELLRWLANDNITFLGYRESLLETIDGQDALAPIPGSGLGILEETPSTSRSFAALPAAARAKAREPHLLILTKANSRSRVHRPVYMDYVGIKMFDDTGAVIGERRFLGLLTASAYNQSITQIPVLRDRFTIVTEHLDLVQGSHSAKDLQQYFETYPRDELFQTSAEQMLQAAPAVLHLLDRRQTRIFMRADDYGRYLSFLVYLPRDRYTTTVRQRIESILQTECGGESVDYTARVGDSILARLHYVVRLPHGAPLPDIEPAVIEAQVAAAARNWLDDFTRALVDRLGDAAAPPLLRAYAQSFPESYKEDFTPKRGVKDVLTIESLQPGELWLDLYPSGDNDGADTRFKIIRVGAALPLSKVLPILQGMGVEVLDEYPYEITRPGGANAWILEFGLVMPDRAIDEDSLPQRFADTFRAVWSGRAENDGFNALVVHGGLTWRQAMILRAYSRYLRQAGSTFGQDYIEGVFAANVDIAQKLVQLFETQFDPNIPDDGRADREAAQVTAIEEALDGVISLDHDRILRSFLALVRATLRTNAFRPSETERSALALKFDSAAIPDLPLPVPMFEMWVYSPRVEGVHLRFGKVARGGLRWSDRREDFRTEILGLVKAQEVKNAVIVPVGAKGGFYPKHLPDPSVARDAWMAEGRAAYREFISALLGITDNLVDGEVVPPKDVVRRDSDDPYLVVAADKGTASFSDLANEISAEFDYWLGDAFASGGSVGYDHKEMGITARGAWISVQRHFREMGVDTQTEDFTVIGVGDMSGDVFGNGMLLSEHIKLLAAFDHRDIFIDPTPDRITSFAERKRLAALPRSSWTDYNPELISEGGGVFSRNLKSITITPQMQTALGLDPALSRITPQDLIRAILQAPADLLWNGGIGTYVRAETETNAEAGDKANDAIRVTGNALRVKVIGEGGNLGLTQLGRIEAARNGVRLNTDAIDNSAGVDTSDHEVNLKILLDDLVRSGTLTQEERNALLVDMKDSVSFEVLKDNYRQNVVLGNARAGAASLVTVHQRMIRELERTGELNRAVEYLPDDEEFETRRLAGEGLTSPEFSVLLAYAKITLAAALNESDVSEDAWFQVMLSRYFPKLCIERFPEAIQRHPLRGQIITTVTTNELINIGGITFAFRVAEENGADVPEIVRAAMASMEIWDILGLRRQINALDNVVSTEVQTAMHLETRRLLDRCTRWFLQTRGGSIDVGQQIAAFGPVVEKYASTVPDALRGQEAARLRIAIDRYVQQGVPRPLATQVSALLEAFALLPITDICARVGEQPDTVLPLYFELSDRYDIDETLLMISALPRGDRWTGLARQALRTDLYGVLGALTENVLRTTPASDAPSDRIAQWESQHEAGLARARGTLDEIAAQEEADLATLSVALRVLRNLVAQGTTASDRA